MDRRLASTWWALKIALGVAPFLAGLDKFFNRLTNWIDYLNPVVLQFVPIHPGILMRCIGIIEMIVGLLILTFWTRIGAYLAALWLVAIAVNLVSMGQYYDIAVRDLLLAVSAFALARLTAVRQGVPARSVAAAAAAAPQWEASPRDILSLKL